MFGNNLLLPSRHAARPLRSVQLWNQDEISSEFDTPYSLIIQYPPTQKPPHPHIRGHYAKERMIPTSLNRRFLFHSGGRPSNVLPQFLWERLVFACFFISLLLLSYSLAGLGYAGHDYATCTSFNDHSHTIAKPLPAITVTTTNSWTALKVGRSLREERLSWKIDHSLRHRPAFGTLLLTDAGDETTVTAFPTDHPPEIHEPPTLNLAS